MNRLPLPMLKYLRTSPLLPFVAALLIAMPASFTMTGCRGHGEIRQWPAYPAASLQGETLDIQVFRHETQIEFTNTTARAFGPSTIWLNRRFSREIPRLEVGETLTFPLRDFRDRFGEPFRAGGFFALERPERLAVAELEILGPMDEPVVLGLVVVGSGL